MSRRRWARRAAPEGPDCTTITCPRGCLRGGRAPPQEPARDGEREHRAALGVRQVGERPEGDRSHGVRPPVSPAQSLRAGGACWINRQRPRRRMVFAVPCGCARGGRSCARRERRARQGDLHALGRALGQVRACTGVARPWRSGGARRRRRGGGRSVENSVRSSRRCGDGAARSGRAGVGGRLASSSPAERGRRAAGAVGPKRSVVRGRRRQQISSSSCCRCAARGGRRRGRLERPALEPVGARARRIRRAGGRAR